MRTTLTFCPPQEVLAEPNTLLIAGRRAHLLDDALRSRLPADLAALWPAMLEGLTPGDSGDATSTWLGGEKPRRVAALALPEVCSRHNAPGRPDALATLVAAHAAGKGDLGVLVRLGHADHALAAACALARCFPEYGRKSRRAPSADPPDAPRTVKIAFEAVLGKLTDADRWARTAEAVRLAARLVDMPAAELTTDRFADEATDRAKALGATVEFIHGRNLDEAGFGGLWGVGRAATHGPALVVLSHVPKRRRRTLAWVGKGIVYDTGGLSLKGKADMPGMKMDMGGAAAVLGAFLAAVEGKSRDAIHAVLCLAENAVGPEALRPDDVLTLYSGRTVEVNNTDAEGRLVVADGVAYASKHLAPDVIVDLATLTGAQLIATGKRHAAIVSNDAALEAAAVRAGLASGDLVHPLLYCPELFRGEFRSEVADMKNSVKDRMNAQTSCAAQFIAEHLGDFSGGWLHVDLAGPAMGDGRGTGFGVGFLLGLLDAL